MQALVEFLIASLLQIYQGIFQRKKIENRLRFHRIIAMSLWLDFFGLPCSNYCAPVGKPSLYGLLLTERLTVCLKPGPHCMQLLNILCKLAQSCYRPYPNMLLPAVSVC